MPVEGRVVQLAERQPVPDGRFASGFGVGHDVRGVEEFGVPEAAEGALSPVRVEDPLAETSLMEAMPYGSGDVLAPTAAAVVVDEPGFLPLVDGVFPVVHLDRERERARIVTDDEYRPDGQVPAPHEAEEIDERQMTLHGEPEPPVVPMSPILAAVPVVEAVWCEYIVIGTGRHGRNRQRRVGQYLRLENPLRTDEGNTEAVQRESLSQERARQDVVSSGRDLRIKPVEGGQTNPAIPVSVEHGAASREGGGLVGNSPVPSPRGVSRRRDGNAKESTAQIGRSPRDGPPRRSRTRGFDPLQRVDTWGRLGTEFVGWRHGLRTGRRPARDGWPAREIRRSGR